VFELKTIKERDFTGKSGVVLGKRGLLCPIRTKHVMSSFIMFHVKHKVTDRSGCGGGAGNKNGETKMADANGETGRGRSRELLADTETGKYLAQQIVGTELARNG
jgi:hypothetical protein